MDYFATAVEIARAADQAVRERTLADIVPDQADVDAIRRANGFQKPKTRVELKAEAKPLEVVDEKKFRGKVWHRDRNRCRCCGRKVIKTLARVPERGEVHHIHGRTGDLRYEDRAALLTCLRCHERLTGRVNRHRLVVVASKTFQTRQGTFTDARETVHFREAA